MTAQDQFNQIMSEIYADRDNYSRGKIIELAKEAFSRVIKDILPQEEWIDNEIKKLTKNSKLRNYSDRDIELGAHAFKQGYVVTWQYANGMR